MINGGSWAAGEIRRTIAIARQAPDLSAVVLCGRDDALLRRVRNARGVHAVPCTRDIVAYLAAAEVIIDNAGGLTCWEAMACHVPVLLFRPLAGHGTDDARTLAAAGLAQLVSSPEALVPVIREAAAAGAPAWTRTPFLGADAVAQILAAVESRDADHARH